MIHRSQEADAQINLLRLVNQTIVANNFGVQALGSESRTSEGVGQHTRQEILNSFAFSLAKFQGLLSSETAHSSSTYEAYNMAISFGIPLSSLSTMLRNGGFDNSRNLLAGDVANVESGHYIFPYPILLSMMPVDPRNPTESSGRVDLRQACSRSPWADKLSIQTYVACNIFNMALFHHEKGLVQNERRLLEKADTLYQSAALFLQREVETTVSKMCADPLERLHRWKQQHDADRMDNEQQRDCSSSRPAFPVILEIACWNNLSHLRYCKGDYRGAGWCLYTAGEMSIWTHFPQSAITDSPNDDDAVAEELLCQCFLSHLLTWGGASSMVSSQPAPAA